MAWGWELLVVRWLLDVWLDELGVGGCCGSVLCDGHISGYPWRQELRQRAEIGNIDKLPRNGTSLLCNLCPVVSFDDICFL